MPEGPATVLGGLPVIAEVWWTRGDGWTTDDDAGVDEVFWRKRDGSKGAPFSEKMMDKLDAKDPYWESNVIEQVSDHLAYQQYLRELPRRISGIPATPNKVRCAVELAYAPPPSYAMS
jgi:hypothetical protein